MPARPTLADMFIDDALATTKRIRADVQHLRELGTRAVQIGKVAAATTKQKIESTIENVADGILKIEAEWQKPRGAPRKGRR